MSDPGHAHIVLERKAGGGHHNQSLFNFAGFKAMCHLETTITRASQSYATLCETMPTLDTTSPPRCCRPWSLPTYVALAAGRESCHELNARDVDRYAGLLADCYAQFRDGLLTGDCHRVRKCNERCWEHDFVYNVLQYLVDSAAAASKVKQVIGCAVGCESCAEDCLVI